MESVTTAGTARTPVQPARVQYVALVVGVVFLLVGIAGFIPGLTQHYGDLQFLGHSSGAELFGQFQVSILHNLVHLLFGIVGLALWHTAASARGYLIGGGLVYLVLWLYGVLTPEDTRFNFVPISAKDDFLHLVLGVWMIVLGLLVGATLRSSGARRA